MPRSWPRSRRSADENVARPSCCALALSRRRRRAGAEEGGAGRRASPPSGPAWEFGLTAYPTFVRGGENYTSAIAIADRGALHLEARYNYESIGARSAFVGWTFSGGESFTWELTPLLGGAWGDDARRSCPGLEASLAWEPLDFYLEAEYVRSGVDVRDSYLYAWSELGYSPFEWLRVGLAGQRTNAYDSDRDIQRGPFVQFDVASRHGRRVLVQSGIGRPDRRQHDRRDVLSQALRDAAIGITRMNQLPAAFHAAAASRWRRVCASTSSPA